MNKYFNESTYISEFGYLEDYGGFLLMSQDSYNEQLIGEAIKNTGAVRQLKIIAFNLSIIGFGNKNLGQVTIENNLIDIKQYLKDLGFLLDNPTGAKLKEDALTPNRLCRFFRYEIRRFLKESKISTYIFKKYSDHDANMLSICFRGAEYLDLTEAEENYLMKIYENMDILLNTRLQDRLIRVFAAKKGILLKT